MTKIYLIRHGQSIGNKTKNFLGHSDKPLSELGFAQAKKVAEYLKGKNIDAIYSSPLQRAILTATPLANTIGKEIIKAEGLIEIYAGKWENMAFSDIETTFPQSYKIWLEDIGNAVCDEGESVSDVQKRAIAALTSIAEENQGKTIAVVSHGCCMRTLMCTFSGQGLSHMKNIPWVGNASITELTYENGVFTMESVDFQEHLDELVSSMPPNV